MRRFMAVICSLFLVGSLLACKQPTSGLSAGWRELEIPSWATRTVQAFENDECKVVERNFPEKDYHDIFIVFKDDRFYATFKYSDVIMLSIKADDNFTRDDAITLIYKYGVLDAGTFEGEI